MKNAKSRVIWIVLVLCIAPLAHGAMFLYVNGIQGEAVDVNYTGWIEATDFSSSVSSYGSMEIPAVHSLSVSHILDRSLPALLLKTCSNGGVGGTISEVKVVLTNPSDTSIWVYRITLEQARISHISTSATATDHTVSTSFEFDRIVWEYRLSSGIVITEGWDLVNNQPYTP